MLAERYRDDGRAAMSLNALQVKTKEAIQQKIKEGIYTFESVPCGICEGEDFELLSQKDRYGLYVSAVVCKSCGLMQLNPRMTYNSYITFYKQDYHSLYKGVALPTEDYFLLQYLRGEKIYAYLNNNQVIPKHAQQLKVLEVGCGTGGILQYFRNQGCQVKGLDLDEEYVNMGAGRFGLDLRVGTIEEAKFSEQFDIVIYSHVLEHIFSPAKELQAIQSVLAPGGIFYVEVPGVKNILKSCNGKLLKHLQNAHLYYFSLTTLKRLMAASGFEWICGDEVIRSVFRRNQELSTDQDYENDYPDVMEYLQRLEKSGNAALPIQRRIKVFLQQGIIKVLSLCKLDHTMRRMYWKAKLAYRFSPLIRRKIMRQKTD